MYVNILSFGELHNVLYNSYTLYLGNIKILDVLGTHGLFSMLFVEKLSTTVNIRACIFKNDYLRKDTSSVSR